MEVAIVALLHGLFVFSIDHQTMICLFWDLLVAHYMMLPKLFHYQCTTPFMLKQLLLLGL
eukprot:4964644-Karenia_brevis.AAC.1